jgi:hypothetical protein
MAVGAKPRSWWRQRVTRTKNKDRKRVVLESIDEQAAVEPVAFISDIHERFVSPEVVGARNEDTDDDDTQYIHRRSSSPTPTQWRLARM